MLVAVEVDTLSDKLTVVKTKALVERLAYRVKGVDVQALCYTLTFVEADRLIYALTDGPLMVEEINVGNMPTKVEWKALLDTLADRETDVKVHTHGNTLSELKSLETLHTLKDTVA